MVYYFQEISGFRSGGYNLPNFDDIRRDVGAKNIICLPMPGEDADPTLKAMRREALQEFCRPAKSNPSWHTGKVSAQPGAYARNHRPRFGNLLPWKASHHFGSLEDTRAIREMNQRHFGKLPAVQSNGAVEQTETAGR